jgi:4a-hydroxytetrahydrobiopterin dehydratase
LADVLNPDALHHELNRLEGWGGTTEGLEKTFTFRDPDRARTFVQRVAVLADELDHHPRVSSEGNTVRLFLVTHSAGGVTQSDVELARRIDPLSIDEPPTG